MTLMSVVVQVLRNMGTIDQPWVSHQSRTALTCDRIAHMGGRRCGILRKLSRPQGLGTSMAGSIGRNGHQRVKT